jgi:hypothetical protein
MSAVPEMINEQYAGKYTWKQITGDKKRLKPANPVQLSPGLSKHPLVRPDGTVEWDSLSAKNAKLAIDILIDINNERRYGAFRTAIAHFPLSHQ